MKTKDLIAKLQKLVDEHEPHIPIMGEHEIVIDCWRQKSRGEWEYAGFSGDIAIDKSGCGVYDILVSVDSWKSDNADNG